MSLYYIMEHGVVVSVFISPIFPIREAFPPLTGLYLLGAGIDEEEGYGIECVGCT